MEGFTKVVTWLSELPTPAKVTATLALILVCGTVVLAMWAPQKVVDAKWPEVMSLDTLTNALRDESARNKTLLLAVLDTGDNGLYAFTAAEKLKIGRDELVYRAKDLATRKLLESRALTDINYRISEDVWRVVGAGRHELLRKLLL